MRAMPIGRWFLFSAVIGALVLVAGGAVMANSLVQLREARDRIILVIDPAAMKTLDLTLALAGQEGSIRSYGLTKDPRYLQAYRQAAADERRALAELRSLLPDDGPRLDTITGTIDAWRRDYADQVAAGTPLTTELGEVGATRFGEVRALVEQERTALERRHAQATATVDERTTDLYLALGVLLAVVLGLLVLLSVIVRHVLLRPVTDLAHQVDEVTKGDFEREIHVDRPAELAKLAGHIDGMRREIIRQWQLSEEQAAELRRSNSELEQFAYVASHDLQEPLRKVASFTQMLEQRYGDQLDERAKQYIAFAVDGAKRMQLLINDLLDFSRVGRIGGEKAPIDSEIPLEAALRNLEAQIEETGGTVTHDDLPEVVGNRSQLTQLFQNLVGNALKFRSDEPPVVHISAKPLDDGMWEFACADNGIGIEEKYVERIFLIFQRLHARDAYPGTGIGLALCRKIVEYHGGRIWVDTAEREGKGTTIRWTLPGATST
ncbi:sensor histidine kinase [Thermoactinospora rubra]|uniref:sensor histidine kinase n=1 Tax=Thermoactinospora rubra TaxID=1088767 RepID=UPI000A116213|nr:ATP-binding protein [Thermoactinospora rubra]